MNAKVFVIEQLRRNRVGKISETELDGRRIGNHFRDDFTDGLVNSIRFGRRRFPYGLVVLDDPVHIRYVQQGASEHAGHVPVYFDNAKFRAFPYAGRDINRGAKGKIACFVHR